MSDGPPELACIGSQTEWPVTLLSPWLIGLARCDISHLYLTGQLKLLAIAIGLAGPVLNMNLIVD